MPIPLRSNFDATALRSCAKKTKMVRRRPGGVTEVGKVRTRRQSRAIRRLPAPRGYAEARRAKSRDCERHAVTRTAEEEREDREAASWPTVVQSIVSGTRAPPTNSADIR
jgi:hypothetical protein